MKRKIGLILIVVSLFLGMYGMTLTSKNYALNESYEIKEEQNIQSSFALKSEEAFLTIENPNTVDQIRKFVTVLGIGVAILVAGGVGFIIYTQKKKKKNKKIDKEKK